jgi:hypothetical protein
LKRKPPLAVGPVIETEHHIFDDLNTKLLEIGGCADTEVIRESVKDMRTVFDKNNTRLGRRKAAIFSRKCFSRNFR